MMLLSMRVSLLSCLLLWISAVTATLAKSPSLLPKHKPKLASAPRIRNDKGDVFQKNAPSNNNSYNKSEAAWVSGIKNSLASAMAAASSKIILAPFDTIKTLQQHSRCSVSGNPLTLMQAAQTIVQRPRGFLELYVSH